MIKYPLVVYSDKLIPNKFGGLTLGPLILIRPKYKNDLGLHLHELEHVKQFFKYLLLYPILYTFCKKFRLAMEVAAYKKQLTITNNIDWAAKALSTKYGLDITEERAKECLLN